MIIDARKTAVALAVVGAVAVAGCSNKASVDNVDRRSVERWNYLISHKAEKAYDYLSPGFRQTRKREDYASSMNNRPVQWTAAKFSNKECEAERCKVTVDVSYKVVAPGAGMGMKSEPATRPISETWILVDGEWFFLPST